MGSPEPLVALLMDFMAGRAPRSLASAGESSFQIAVEMVLNPPSTRVGELCLVMDPRKPYGCGRLGFAHIIFAPGGVDVAVLLELKCLPLPGLLSGRRRCWISKPNHKELGNLSKEISDMTESELDELQFAYLSGPPERRCTISTTVGKIRQDALKQVQGYSRALKRGVTIEDTCSGVYDIRVEVLPGDDTLRSFTLVAIGARRILWQSGEEVETNFSYRCTAI